MKVIKIDDSGSVLIDTNKGFSVWVDLWERDGDILADWNKYIFFDYCSLDQEIKAFQNDSTNFINCTELAISYYIMHKK